MRRRNCQKLDHEFAFINPPFLHGTIEENGARRIHFLSLTLTTNALILVDYRNPSLGFQGFLALL